MLNTKTHTNKQTKMMVYKNVCIKNNENKTYV